MYVAKRSDGTFETTVNELPYHVIEDDPLFQQLSEEYADLKSGTALVDGVLMEDNRGTSGWIDGNPFIMKDFGPLPQGFSELPPEAELAARARAERDRLLAETDYLIMPDYPLTDEQRNAVQAYRQALRDVPKQEGFPHEIEWPDKPKM